MGASNSVGLFVYGWVICDLYHTYTYIKSHQKRSQCVVILSNILHPYGHFGAIVFTAQGFLRFKLGKVEIGSS